MEIMVDFPGGSRVDAHFKSFTVETDQPTENDGQNAAPTPFEVFLASLATCAGFYILGFCKKRGIPYEGIRLVQTMEQDSSTKIVRKVVQKIQLPQGFPEQYISAVKRAADSCLVKKHLEAPPAFEITATVRS
jgi:ribosomal protein S12 methylthiotransferase accessory factor